MRNFHQPVLRHSGASACGVCGYTSPDARSALTVIPQAASALASFANPGHILMYAAGDLLSRCPDAPRMI
ncbi:hypothetical protein DXU84_12285 [Rahnella sp. RcJ3]|nr:hypothetical protein [Rahnella sp. RcJ3]